MKNRILLTKSINPASNLLNRFLRRWTVLIAGFVLTCLTLASKAGAQCSQRCNDGLLDTALGTGALVSDTGGANTAIGFDALYSTTTGGANTASGKAALYSNTTGYDNTATGWDSLVYNTIGYSNTATGAGALYNNQSGNYNTAAGSDALNYNYTGDNNTAIGSSALYLNSTGSNNTALGSGAGGETSGSNNIAVGYAAGANLSTGDNNIDIGNVGATGEANTIRIGTIETQTATYIAGIRGTPIAGATAVGVTSSGQLGVRASSARFKDAIKPMGNASEAILALRPVSFRYKKAFDPKGTPEFGLIAEDVAKVNADLVTTDEHGRPLTVRYDEVNAMLLNEFLKEHKRAAAEEFKIEDLEKKLIEEQRQLESLTTTLQNLSKQLELVKASPRIVVNNR